MFLFIHSQYSHKDLRHYVRLACVSDRNVTNICRLLCVLFYRIKVVVCSCVFVTATVINSLVMLRFIHCLELCYWVSAYTLYSYSKWWLWVQTLAADSLNQFAVSRGSHQYCSTFVRWILTMAFLSDSGVTIIIISSEILVFLLIMTVEVVGDTVWMEWNLTVGRWLNIVLACRTCF